MDHDEPAHITTARTVYDHSANQYAEHVGTEVAAEFETPLDRAVIDAFAEHVAAQAPGAVIDVGCGTGRVTAHLARRGLAVRGVDISARMIDLARAAHPHLDFQIGSLTDLPAADGSMVGAVYWYSIIATPPSALPAAWDELDRVLATSGHVLIAFQAGANDRIRQPKAYGSSTTLTLYHHDVEDVARSLDAAGFDVGAVVHRKAELPHETTPHAALLVHRGHARRAVARRSFEPDG